MLFRPVMFLAELKSITPDLTDSQREGSSVKLRVYHLDERRKVPSWNSRPDQNLPRQAVAFKLSPQDNSPFETEPYPSAANGHFVACSDTYSPPRLMKRRNVPLWNSGHCVPHSHPHQGAVLHRQRIAVLALTLNSFFVGTLWSFHRGNAGPLLYVNA